MGGGSGATDTPGESRFISPRDESPLGPQLRLQSAPSPTPTPQDRAGSASQTLQGRAKLLRAGPQGGLCSTLNPTPTPHPPAITGRALSFPPTPDPSLPPQVSRTGPSPHHLPSNPWARGPVPLQRSDLERGLARAGLGPSSPLQMLLKSHWEALSQTAFSTG